MNIEEEFFLETFLVVQKRQSSDPTHPRFKLQIVSRLIV